MKFLNSHLRIQLNDSSWQIIHIEDKHKEIIGHAILVISRQELSTDFNSLFNKHQAFQGGYFQHLL